MEERVREEEKGWGEAGQKKKKVLGQIIRVTTLEN